MSHAAVTQGDTPAVEPATEALSTDNAQPELPERKADFARRMEMEGTAKEADELRVAERKRFRKQGMGTQAARDAAWASAMKKFPLVDDATDFEEEAEPEEEDELDESGSEIMFDGCHEELAELDRRCRDQPVDLSADITWAYKNMNRQRGSVRPLDAPSPGALAQLQVALSMGPVKYVIEVANKVLVKPVEEKTKRTRGDDGLTQDERLQKLREALGVPPGPLPDFVIGDYPNKEL